MNRTIESRTTENRTTEKSASLDILPVDPDIQLPSVIENQRVTALRMILPAFILAALFFLITGIFNWYEVHEPVNRNAVPMTETSSVVQVNYEGDGGLQYTSLANDDSWMGQIFAAGTSESLSVQSTSQIKLAGLSEKVQSKLKFNAEAFLQTADSFLKNERIRTELIYFENRESCSADGAVLYIASMSGISDQKLRVLWCPEYPQQYILMLSPLESRKEELQTESNTAEVQEQSVSQTISQNAELQEQPVSQTIPRSTQLQEQPVLQTELQMAVQTQISQAQSQISNQGSQSGNQNAYDATFLTIRKVPKELLNYIGNQYLLQYSLYAYLYQKGYEKVTTATVTEYQINGDERYAEISFFLNTGKYVQGIYDLDSKVYRFTS